MQAAVPNPFSREEPLDKGKSPANRPSELGEEQRATECDPEPPEPFMSLPNVGTPFAGLPPPPSIAAYDRLTPHSMDMLVGMALGSASRFANSRTGGNAPLGMALRKFMGNLGDRETLKLMDSMVHEVASSTPVDNKEIDDGEMDDGAMDDDEMDNGEMEDGEFEYDEVYFAEEDEMRY